MTLLGQNSAEVITTWMEGHQKAAAARLQREPTAV